MPRTATGGEPVTADRVAHLDRVAPARRGAGRLGAVGRVAERQPPSACDSSRAIPRTEKQYPRSGVIVQLDHDVVQPDQRPGVAPGAPPTPAGST